MCGHNFDYSLFFPNGINSVPRKRQNLETESPLGLQFVVTVLEFGFKVFDKYLVSRWDGPFFFFFFFGEYHDRRASREGGEEPSFFSPCFHLCRWSSVWLTVNGITRHRAANQLRRVIPST